MIPNNSFLTLLEINSTNFRGNNLILLKNPIDFAISTIAL